MAGVGDNSIAGDRLLSLVERIEHLDAEIKGLNADKKDVFAEARGTGFDVAAIKRQIRRRRLDAADRDEMDALDDLYWRTLEAAARARARANSKTHATPHDPETGEIIEHDEHPTGGLETTVPTDDAEIAARREAPLESGAGAAESPAEGGRPTESLAATTDGEGDETTGVPLPEPDERQDTHATPDAADAVAGPRGEGEGSGASSPENSESAAVVDPLPTPPAADEGAGTERQATTGVPAARPAPSDNSDVIMVIDKVTGQQRPWDAILDQPEFLRRTAT